MPRYIDAEKIPYYIAAADDTNPTGKKIAFKSEIDRIPAEDVRPEKHGTTREQFIESINDFSDEVHENAVAHGWWEKEPSFGDLIALCHSELSEALEEYRKTGKMSRYTTRKMGSRRE